MSKSKHSSDTYHGTDISGAIRLTALSNQIEFWLIAMQTVVIGLRAHLAVTYRRILLVMHVLFDRFLPFAFISFINAIYLSFRGNCHIRVGEDEFADCLYITLVMITDHNGHWPVLTGSSMKQWTEPGKLKTIAVALP